MGRVPWRWVPLEKGVPGVLLRLAGNFKDCVDWKENDRRWQKVLSAQSNLHYMGPKGNLPQLGIGGYATFMPENFCMQTTSQ